MCVSRLSIPLLSGRKQVIVWIGDNALERTDQVRRGRADRHELGDRISVPGDDNPITWEVVDQRKQSLAHFGDRDFLHHDRIVQYIPSFVHPNGVGLLSSLRPSFCACLLYTSPS